ncbi:MAG: hypothetical protein HYY09_06150 [Firmicutes bacterium]|nr:hypothetical protein [Bacillota bacterium]
MPTESPFREWWKIVGGERYLPVPLIVPQDEHKTYQAIRILELLSTQPLRQHSGKGTLEAALSSLAKQLVLRRTVPFTLTINTRVNSGYQLRSLLGVSTSDASEDASVKRTGVCYSLLVDKLLNLDPRMDVIGLGGPALEELDWCLPGLLSTLLETKPSLTADVKGLAPSVVERTIHTGTVLPSWKKRTFVLFSTWAILPKPHLDLLST